MSVLVDDAIWAWRGRRWAHLVSDSDLDELHDLAHRIGMPYVAFQGDHYDVHEDLRLAALSLGAVATPSRDLVRALRAAGLRQRGGVEAWVWRSRLAAAPESAPAALVATGAASTNTAATIADATTGIADALDRFGPGARLGNAERGGVRLVSVSTERLVPVDAGLERLSATLAVHRSAGERGTFVEVAYTSAGPGGAPAA